MTLMEWAIYHCAAERMTEAERATATALAKQADAGDIEALNAFNRLTLSAVFDSPRNRQLPNNK